MIDIPNLLLNGFFNDRYTKPIDIPNLLYTKPAQTDYSQKQMVCKRLRESLLNFWCWFLKQIHDKQWLSWTFRA